MKVVTIVTLVTLADLMRGVCNTCTTGWFEGRIWGLYKSVTLVTHVTLIYQAILSKTL